MSVAKEEARKVIETIPDTASWDDIMYELYVRQKVEAALDQMEAGEVVPHEEVEQWLRSQCE
jgi:predicted transcriptional regulator